MSPTATTPAQDTALAGEPVGLHSRFMLRVAGLPADTVLALRAPETADWAVRTAAEEDRLVELGARLSDPLSEAVGGTEDAGLRRRLLALRRQVFNNRLPADPDAARALAADLGGGTGTDLAAWLDARVRWERLRREGDTVLAAGLARTRAALRELALDDRLRRGLLLASPTLEERLEAFAADPAPVPGKRARKMERSLLSYLYRTACKTSPFSTLTGVALGGFDTGAANGAASTRIRDDWTGHPRLNVVVLTRLAELVAADPRRRADLPVTLASGWKLDEDRVRYVQRAVTAGDDSAPISFDAAQDRLLFLRRQGALDGMLALLRGQDRTLRHGDLARWLATTTGADDEEAERYLSALRDLGMLQLPDLDTGVHSGDPLAAFQRSLRALRRPWADALAARLDGPADALARYPHADLPTRRALLAGLRTDLLALQAELGAEHPTLPQTLLYEDVSAGTTTAGLTEWTTLAAGPLRSIGRILPAFDVALPQRLTLKGFFLARFGRGGHCADVLRLVHDFHEDIFRQYVQFTATKDDFLPDGSHAPEENWLGMPEIAAVDRARAALTARVRADWSVLPPGADEFVLDDATVDEVADALAGAAPVFQPQSHFLQLARRDGDPLVVLNNSFGGLCFPFTRFTHCFDGEDGTDLTTSLREDLRGLLPPGAVFAEITAGAATTNLNLHGRLTDHEIVCPGEHSTAPEESRIHLDDLYAVHDVDTDRLVLRSARLDREVVPLYLGYLVPMVLPEIPRTLLLFSPTARSVLDVWRGVPAGPEDQGVTGRPRVRHHALVLQRRSWTAADGSLPLRAPNTGDGDWYLGWQRWRTRHGLPARVFATVRRQTADGEDSGPFGGSKPQYVDFDSPLSLMALEGLLTGTRARTVFEEMLPGEDELHVTSPRGRHVAELAVEMLPGPVSAPAVDRPEADRAEARTPGAGLPEPPVSTTGLPEPPLSETALPDARLPEEDGTQ
ncbi:lantibiotic dehydratase [Streptomyces sp. 142MFCol3.1]|uniref:lantibiotic dehydratase n=1 Tax=Streptomyces sp. 142MFCol3.1 TaxID=1172179 RepID=UPI0003F5A267|nr:lantibiotic dehydratase [Streptomyces sp. 142MFCol3.1]